MAHWRAMVGERHHFDVADLGGKDLLVEVESARPGTVTGVMNGRKAETRVVLVKYVGHERAHGFKATLCKTMVSLHGTGDIEKWAGRWVWLYAAMVNDPSQGKGAMCEAVRIRPRLPTEQEIEAAQRARGGTKRSAPARDEAADQALVEHVCKVIDLSATADEIEAAIAPHRDEIKKMATRLQTIVLSAKKARLATIEQPAQEGAGS